MLDSKSYFCDVDSPANIVLHSMDTTTVFHPQILQLGQNRAELPSEKP